MSFPFKNHRLNGIFFRRSTITSKKTKEFPLPSEFTNAQDGRQIYSVSELTSEIKALLEDQIGEIWVKGEISNLRIPSSGHAYFTLKDENAQLAGVLFRGRMQKLRFEPDDGMEVIVHGKLSLYEPRGNYQIIVDFMEPAGLGALQAAFEKLKEKLEKEGLFKPERKRKLPFLPNRIGVVTSPTGAAIRDILKVLGRRNPNLSILLAPAKVQGEGSAQEIAAQIANLNQYNEQLPEPKKLDLIIVGRGGGSLEDLWAFNEEVVARAIFQSQLPIVSAVGHEIDFTISDFVADVRAPTPSAAAEVVVPVLSDLQEMIETLQLDLKKNIRKILEDFHLKNKNLYERLVRPDRRISDLRLRLADWNERLVLSLKNLQKMERKKMQHLIQVLLQVSPKMKFLHFHQELSHLHSVNLKALEKILLQSRNRLHTQIESLNALSPLKILSRGYGVIRDEHTKKVLKKIQDFHKNQILELVIEDGFVQSKVLNLSPNRQKPWSKEKINKPPLTKSKSLKNKKAKKSPTQRSLWS